MANEDLSANANANASDQDETLIHETGIVGLFDILGYQSFLENNEPSEAVSKVLDTLNKMPKMVHEHVRTHFDNLGAGVGSKIYDLVSEIRPLIFSDTILLTFAYKDDDSLETKILRWRMFILEASILARKMFDYGLPVRGAISFGKYVVQKNSFAGRSIIEAFRTGSSVNAAAVVLSKSAIDEFGNVVGGVFPPILVNYPVPTKGGESAARLVVNFAFFTDVNYQSLVGDERAIVSRCFWSHGKTIRPNEYEKLTNTEMLLRYLKTHG